MKKALAIIMAFAMVTGVAFAQTATYGVDANFEAQVMKDAHSNTWEQNKVNKPVDVFNPEGFSMTEYSVAPWINLDWAKASVKAAASYDAVNNNLSDFSSMTLTSTWKDFYGLQIKSVAVAKNKTGVIGDDSTVAVAPVKYESVVLPALSADHNVWITYDKLADNGIKLYTKYSATDFFAIGNVAGFGPAGQKLFDGFKETGLELKNTEFESNVVYKQGTVTKSTISGTSVNRFSKAWFEAKNLFGVWTARLNDDAEMKLRIAYPDTDVTIGRSNFGIGKYNNILGGYLKNDDLDGNAVQADGETPVTALSEVQWRTDLNMLNTIKPMENLTVKTALVIPTQATRFVDWLEGKNVSISGDYVLEGVGTIGAGTRLSMGYVAQSPLGGLFQGPHARIATYLSDANAIIAATMGAGGSQAQGIGLALTNAIADATADDSIAWGNAFWLDANLNTLLGEKNSLFVTLGLETGDYIDQVAFAKSAAKLGTETVAIPTLAVSRLELGVEGSSQVMDALKVSAAAMVKMGMGYDYKAATGAKFAVPKSAAQDAAGTLYTASYTEANVLTSVYDITPLELNVRADFTVNPTVALWLQNGFVANNSDLQDATVKPTGGRNAFGFVSKDSIEIGAKLASTEKSTFTISSTYNLYLGVPTASELYLDGANSAAKKTIDAAYGEWVSNNFNPLSVSVGYTYAY